MDSSTRITGARRANIIYFLNRAGQIEHPHLIRVHHFCHSGVHLRDVKRWLSELRGIEMPNSFAWSYQTRYNKGLVWLDLTDDDLLTPISDCEYVLLGSLIPVENSKSDSSPSPEMKESEDINVEDRALHDEEGDTGKRTLPPGSAGRWTNHRKTSHGLRNFLKCKAVDTVDSTLLYGVAASAVVYRGFTTPAESNGSLLRLTNSPGDINKRESEQVGGGKRSRNAGRTHIPKPTCSHCGKPFNPEKLHSHMTACRGFKRSGK